MTADRQYVRSRSGMWHGFVTWTRLPGAVRTVCGRTLRNREGDDLSDRIPRDAPWCENCGRIVASRTDVEPRREHSYVLRGPAVFADDDDGAVPV